jgi:hypothetical protein
VKSGQSTTGFGRFEIAALGVVALAAALRVWGIDAGLPHLMTRPDEEILVLQTRFPAQGSFNIEWPGQHPGIPSAYIYLLWVWGAVGLKLQQFFGLVPAGDYLAVLGQTPDRILFSQRFLSAAAGTATVVAVMWAARRELGARVAILAGLILATCVFHVRDSHSIKPDIAVGLFTIFALGLLAPVARKLTRRGACVAGLTIGLAMAMKPPGILLLLPAWVACVQGGQKKGWRRILPAEVFLLGTISGLVFVATSPDFVFNPETAARIIAIPGFVLPKLFGSGATTLVSGATGAAAHAQTWPGLLYHYEFSLRYAFGLPAAFFLPIALLWGFFSRQTLVSLCSIFFLIAYLVFGTSPVLLSRYMTPMLPVAALLIAAGVVAAVDRLPFAQARYRNASLAVVAALLLWEPMVSAVRFDQLMATPDTRVQASEWMAGHTKKHERIALHGGVYWTWGDPQIPRGRKLLRPDLTRAGLLAAKPDLLVVHDHPLFASATDWQAIAALGSSLALVAEFDPFVEGAGAVVYESQDAFYLPTRGYRTVRAPGPLIRIYAIAADEPKAFSGER